MTVNNYGDNAEINVVSQNFNNQPVVDWAKQNLANRIKVQLKFNSVKFKVLLTLIVFFVPIGITALGINNYLKGGSVNDRETMFFTAGIIYVFLTIICIPAFLIDWFSKRNFIRYLDAESVVTRKGTKYNWEKMHFLNYKPYRIQPAYGGLNRLLQSIIYKIMFAGGLEKLNIELIFENGKVVVPALIHNQREIFDLIRTIPVPQNGENL